MTEEPPREATPEDQLLEIITPREVREIFVNLAEIRAESRMQLGEIQRLSSEIKQLKKATETIIRDERARHDENVMAISKRIQVLEEDRLRHDTRWDLASLLWNGVFTLAIALLGAFAGIYFDAKL